MDSSSGSSRSYGYGYDFPKCYCGIKSKIRTAGPSSSNNGRLFFGCSKNLNQRACSFFLWCDQWGNDKGHNRFKDPTLEKLSEKFESLTEDTRVLKEDLKGAKEDIKGLHEIVKALKEENKMLREKYNAAKKRNQMTQRVVVAVVIYLVVKEMFK